MPESETAGSQAGSPTTSQDVPATAYTFRIGKYVTDHPGGVPAPWSGTVVTGEGERLVRDVAKRLAKVKSRPGRSRSVLIRPSPYPTK
jgi:hypothetical protein